MSSAEPPRRCHRGAESHLRRGNPVRRALGLALLLAGAPALAWDAGIVAGQPLAEALRTLSTRHRLPIVFSADRVPASLRVGVLPETRDATTLRDRLLAEHALRCRMLHQRCVVEPTPATADAGAAPPGDAAAPQRLQRLEVTAPSHYSLMRPGASFLDAEDIAATPHLADDVFRLARAIPGVAGGDIGAPFHVRGGQQDELALRLDGLELYKPFHLNNLLNALGIIDSNLIGGIDVYTGAWPSRFGGRNSAVVDIASREVGAGRERRLGVSAINAFYTHAEGDDEGRHGLLASLRRGYLDVVLEFVDPDGEIDPGYYDLFLRHRYQPDEVHTLSLQLLQAGDRILFDGERGDQRSDGEADARYAWLRWQAEWNQSFSSEGVLAFTGLDQRRHGFAFDAFESNAVVADERELSGLRLSQRVGWQASERLLLDAGLEWRDERSDYHYLAEVERYPLFSRVPERYRRAVDRRIDGGQLALWLDGDFMLAPAWQLRTGLRVTRYAPDTRSDRVIDPHLALGWAASDTRRFSLGLGRSSQAQRSDELAIEDGETAFFAPERASFLVLGWEARLRPGLSLRAELYGKRWSNPRPRFENLFEPIELFPETEGDRLRIDPDRASAHGIEVGLDGELAQGRWSLRYAYSRSRERVEGVSTPRRWDQPHTLHLGIDRLFADRWRLSAQLAAHSGWPTTAVSAVQRADGSIEAVYGPRNGERFASYLNLSARLSREHRLAHGRLTWYIEVFNLLDRVNPDQVDQFRLRRNVDGSLTVQRELGGGLPLLPSFGVVYSF